MYYNRSGEPITLEEWSTLMGSSLYRTVAQSWLGPYFISTVWLGLDHSHGGSVPLIFETMVFNEESADPDMLCERYSTEQEARQGHHEMVTLIRATTDVSE